VKYTVHEGGNFEGDMLTDRKPVKLFQCWGDVSPSVQSKNKTRSGVLYTLQRCDCRHWQVDENGVTAVDACQYE